MAYKTVIFSASGKLGDSNVTTKQFSISSIKQRVKESKKSLRTRFRNFIREYSRLVAQGKDLDALKTEFSKDLILYLSEATEGASKGLTINKALGLTSLVPATRMASNRINMIARKATKSFEDKGYITPNIQLKFNELLKELIIDITEKVFGGQVAEGLVDEPDDVEDLEEVQATAKKFSSTRITLFSSKSDIDDVLSSEDLDDEDIEDISIDKVMVASNMIPKAFNGKFTKYSKRVKCFSSEMNCISYLLSQGDAEDQVKQSINKLKDLGVIRTDAEEFSYDIENREDGYKVTLYLHNNELQDTDSTLNIYEGKVIPEDAEFFDKVPTEAEEYSDVINLIDAGLSTSNLMKLEKLIKKYDPTALKATLISKYGSNPIPSLL